MLTHCVSRLYFTMVDRTQWLTKSWQPGRRRRERGACVPKIPLSLPFTPSGDPQHIDGTAHMIGASHAPMMVNLHCQLN